MRAFILRPCGEGAHASGKLCGYGGVPPVEFTLNRKYR